MDHHVEPVARINMTGPARDDGVEEGGELSLKPCEPAHHPYSPCCIKGSKVINKAINTHKRHSHHDSYELAYLSFPHMW